MAAKEEKSKPTADEQHEKHNQKAKENAAESRAKAKDKKNDEAKHVEEDDQKAKHNQKAKENAAESRAESKGKKGDAAKGSKADSAPADKSDADDEIDEAQELDGLLEIFSEHEITEIDMDVAAGMIDEWYDILHKSKDESYKEVAANLKQLKKLLSGKKDQSEEVVELLDELGGQTDELANAAQRGYKGKLHKVGKALRHAAQAIDEAIDSDDEELDEELDDEEI